MTIYNNLNEVEILNKEYSESAIIEKLQKCKDGKSLKDFIQKDIFIITRNDKPPFGNWRSEHILKCFEMAEYFSSLDFIPDFLGLREIFVKVIRYKALSDKLESYKKNEFQFYQDRFPYLSLTPTELERITSKFSLKDFSTFDILAENAIMLFNSLEGIKTISSCSGHNHSLRFFAHSDFGLQINESIVDIIMLKKRFRELFYSDKNRDKISITGKDNRIYIDFFHIPTKDWIEENKKIPVMKLCEKNLNMLINTFGYNPNYNCIDKKYRNSDVQTVDKVRRMLYKFINNLNDNLDLSDEDDEKFWEIFNPRCLVFEREYQGYYQSEIAINVIKKFWKKLEYFGNKLRRNNYLHKRG